MRNLLIFFTLTFSGLILNSCNSTVNLSNDNSSITYTVGGVVTGLSLGETIVLQNNGTDNLTITGQGSASDLLEFATSLSTGESYYITVLTQPSTKTCVVGGNSGTVSGTNITSILVTCSVFLTYNVGGNLNNFLGTGLIIKNIINGGSQIDYYEPTASPYTMPAPLAVGYTYSVTVQSQPANPVQNCTIANPAGTIANTSIINVDITCTTTQFTVGGNISGLASGETIILNDGNNALTVTNSPYQTVVPFTFSPLNDQTTYTVTVTTPPNGKTCSVTNPGGIPLAGSNVTDVVITCSSAGTSTVGGSGVGSGITGLANNSTIILDLSSTVGVTETLAVTNTTGASSVNLPYTFLSTFVNGAAVTVTITNPSSPSQTCTPAGILGPVTVAGNVILPEIICTTNQYILSGNVGGLTAGDILTVSMESTTGGTANPVQTFNINPAALTTEAFDFTVFPIDDGSTYSISVSAFTPVGVSKTCGNPVTGILSGANVTGISITCTTAGASPVSVSISSGFNVTAGTGLGLRLNGDISSDLFVTGSGAQTVTFSTPLLNTGANYTVAIIQQPDRSNSNGIDQLCYLSPNASGTLPGGGVTITATCSTTAYSVTGSIAGMGAGETLDITDTATSQTITVSSPWTYSFTNAFNDGTNYTLQLSNPPYGKDCKFNNSGTAVVGPSPVTGGPALENITCTSLGTNTVSVTVSGMVPANLQVTNTTAGTPFTETLTFNALGTSPFTAQPLGSTYNVTISNQPAGMVCGLTTPGQGTVGGAVNVSISCSSGTAIYTVSGTVYGLGGVAENVVLQNNVGEVIQVNGDLSGTNTFSFTQTYLDTSYYNVDLVSFTSTNYCSIANGAGIINAANILNVVIYCGQDPFEIDDTSPASNVLAIDSVSPVHTLHLDTDVDFYKITVTNTALPYYMGVSDGSSGCSFDSVLELQDSIGSILTTDDNSGPGKCPAILYDFTFSGAGTYYLKVSANIGNRGAYVLDIYQMNNPYAETFAGSLNSFFSNDLTGGTSGTPPANIAYTKWNHSSALPVSPLIEMCGIFPTGTNDVNLLNFTVGLNAWSGFSVDTKYAFISSDAACPGSSIAADLVSSVIDLSLYPSKAFLVFDAGFNRFGNLNEILAVQIRTTRTSGVWQTLDVYNQIMVSTNPIDITMYGAGDSSVEVRFVYISDGLAKYAMIDNVYILAK